MKIGILTFFESDNYGTVLQAYALQEYLNNLGHNAIILNLKRDINASSKKYEITKKRKESYFDRFFIKIRSGKHKFDYNKKKIKFQNFRRDFLVISERQYLSGNEIKKDVTKFDCFISGGDQIWNPYHKTFSLDYMCSFLSDENKCISYGSSFGVNKIEEDIIESIATCLKKYQALMVREQSGVRIIKQLGIDAKQVVDPVFLIANKWKDYVQTTTEKKYALVYGIVDYPKGDDLIIKRYAKDNNLTIKIMPENRRNYLNRFEKCFDFSPIEFLNCIANAEVVFTNSFHGLAFSLIFHKKVILLNTCSNEAKEKSIRLKELCELCELKNYDLEHVKDEQYCNFEKIYALTKESQLLLNNELKKVNLC